MLKLDQKLKERDLEPHFRALLRGLVAKVPFLELVSLRSDPVLVSAKTGKRAGRPDWLLEVTAGARRWVLVVEGKRQAQPREVREGVLQLKNYLAQLPPRTARLGVLLAPFISEESARICEDAGVGYADLAGNVRLVFDQIFIETRVAGNPFHETRSVKSVFNPKTVRVLRVLLQGPLRAWKVKELEKKAAVSLGLVSGVRQQLLAHEWAVEEDGGIRITKPERVLDAWTKADDWERRTTCHEYSVLAVDAVEVATQVHHFLKKQRISHAFTQWIAAHLRHPHTTPPVATVYVDHFPDDADLKKGLLARRVESGGRLRLVKPNDEGVLNPLQTLNGLPLVGDVQIYLDLINAGQRGDEAAAELRHWPDFSGGWS